LHRDLNVRGHLEFFMLLREGTKTKEDKILHSLYSAYLFIALALSKILSIGP
jgi:hypothetical protein